MVLYCVLLFVFLLLGIFVSGKSDRLLLPKFLNIALSDGRLFYLAFARPNALADAELLVNIKLTRIGQYMNFIWLSPKRIQPDPSIHSLSLSSFFQIVASTLQSAL